MNRTITQLWHGSLEPIRHMGNDNLQMHELEELIQRNQKNLKEALSEKEQELLQKYNDCLNEYLFVTSEQVFCDGFSLGTRLTAEAFLGTQQLE